MKLILISIVLIVMFVLIFNKHNIENFIVKQKDSKDDDIELPINDKYLPINVNAGIDKRNDSNKNYSIIDMYKSILNRQPNKQELINDILEKNI